MEEATSTGQANTEVNATNTTEAETKIETSTTEDKKKKLEESVDDNEQSLKKQRVEEEDASDVKTEQHNVDSTCSAKEEKSETSTSEAEAKTSASATQPTNVENTPTPTKAADSTATALAAAMQLNQGSSVVASSNISVSTSPATPQGQLIGFTSVFTNLVVPRSVIQASIASVNQVQQRLSASGVTFSYSATTVSQAPLMNHETIITIHGPFAYVHDAYVSLVQLAYGSALTCVKLVVANDEASALIGKQGAAIRDIRLGLGGAPNCIKVLERNPMNPNQRLVTLTGDIALAIKAHELIQEKIVAFQQNRESMTSSGEPAPTTGPNPGDITAQVQVPNETLGAVIGRGGSRVQEIRSLSAAKVTIEPPVDNFPHRLVTITGSNESVEWAKYLISIAMTGGEPSQSLGNSIPPGMVATVNHQIQAGGARPQYSVADLQAAGYTPEQITAYMTSQSQTTQQQPGFHAIPGGMKLVLPNEGVGSIIGKGGCKINQMRKLTGAKINVLEPMIGSPVRSVTIEGEAYNVGRAQLMLTMAQAGVDVSTWQAHDLQNAMQPQHGMMTQQMGAAYQQQQPRGAYGGAYGAVPQNQPGQYSAYRGY